jgi:hypothetical protein
VNYQIEEKLQESFRFANELFKAGAYHSALNSLAEIFHCLPILDSSTRRRWENRLRSQKLSVETLNAGFVGIEEEVRIIRRILSIGTVWNGDEILLVLMKRIEIDLLLTFLTEFCSYHEAVSLDYIDERIKSIAETKENKHTFEEAKGLMRKNWGLPINSKWLRTVSE